MTMGRLRTFAKDRCGAAAVELALVLPLILVLILVTLEGAHFLYAEHKVAKGVRDGARYAARQAFSNYTCTTGSPAGTINNATVTQQIQDITRTGIPEDVSPVLQGWVRANVTVTVRCVDGQGGLYGIVSGTAPIVTVNALVAYPALFRVFGFNAQLNAFAESAVMGV